MANKLQPTRRKGSRPSVYGYVMAGIACCILVFVVLFESLVYS